MKWITTVILAASLAPTFASAQGCDAWLKPDFWARAGAVEVVGCEGRGVEARDEDGATAMHLAAGYGFVSAINALALIEPEAVNSMDDRGYPPLHYAAEFNANPDMISALLALGAIVDMRSDEDVSALDLAAGNSPNPEVLRRLLAAGANASPEFDTVSHAPEVPVMYAARYNSNSEILAVLLAAGANIGATDMRGYGLLHIAIMSENQPEMIAALLAAGSDVNHQQLDGYTPLMEAIFRSAPEEVILLLLQAGADVNLRDRLGATVLLHAAAARVNPRAIQQLIAAGADVFALNEWGESALHIAASQINNLPVIEALVAAGGNINEWDGDGFTPLHIAARGENAAMIEGMLALGANAAISNVGGLYPYGVAQQNGAMQGSQALEMLEQAVTPLPIMPEYCSAWPRREFWNDITFLEVEACLPFVEINVRSRYGETPLIWALNRTEVDISTIRALLSARPDLGLADIAGSTALHFAASGARLDLVELLLSRGANSNQADEAGQTPLHRATMRNADSPIALLLLNNGADPDIWDSEGRAAGDTEVEFRPESSGN